MSFADKVKGRAAGVVPKRTECIFFARPLPMIAGAYPVAGPEFHIKCVMDPTDRHLVALEGERRLELMRPFFAKGGFVMLAVHKESDRAIAKMWMLTYTPAPSESRAGILPIKLAKDECFIFDIWTDPEFRRQSIALTLAYEICNAAVAQNPRTRWVYGYAHKDNAASRGLMESVYGMWPIQEVTEVQLGDTWVTVQPGSASPKFGPFSKKGRHSGDGVQMPGRPRSGDKYRDYHHPEGFATAPVDYELCDDWLWPGPEWFDNDHPVDAEGRPATPETLPRSLGD